MTDAIGRTLYRLFVSHRNLLEWVTAQQAVAAAPGPSVAAVYRQMSGGTVHQPRRPCWCLPLRQPLQCGCHCRSPLLWLAAPALALWISRAPPVAQHLVITGTEAAATAPGRAAHVAVLRDLRHGRRPHAAAGQLPGGPDSGPGPSHLPHEHRPLPAVHRRAPAISAGSGRSRPWSGSKRPSPPWASLQRFRGHFYNWYDTRDLRPLEPRYVSSVDSGNLAAHLVAVANAAREWRRLPSRPDGTRRPACADALLTGARGAARPARTTSGSSRACGQQLDVQLATIATGMRAIDISRGDPAAQLQALAHHAATLVDIARTLASDARDDACPDLLFWSDATQRSIESWRRDATARRRRRSPP